MKGVMNAVNSNSALGVEAALSSPAHMAELRACPGPARDRQLRSCPTLQTSRWGFANPFSNLLEFLDPRTRCL